MATAKKLPSGNWRVRIYIGKDNTGKPIYKSFTGPTKKSVELEAAEYNVTRKEKPKSELTVREAIQKYIDNHSNVFSPSTVKNYRGYLRNNYKEIEDVKIRDLSEEQVQKWVNSLAKGHSPKTVKNVYYLFVPAVNEAAKGMDLEAKLPAAVKFEANIPTQKEVEQLFAYFQKAPDFMTAIMVAAIMGLRRGETCALEFSDILPNGKLRVNKALALNDQKEWILKYPKTKEGSRELTLPDFLKERMLSLKTDGDKDNRIFHFNPNQLTDNFCSARKKLGFDFRLHDLRHYYASVMLSLNTPDKYAMKRMGHSTPYMLKRVYQHLLDEKDREVDENMDAYMKRYSSIPKDMPQNMTRRRKNGVK